MFVFASSYKPGPARPLVHVNCSAIVGIAWMLVCTMGHADDGIASAGKLKQVGYRLDSRETVHFPAQTLAPPAVAIVASDPLVDVIDSSIATTSTVDGRDIGCRAANQWIPSDILRARARMLVQAFCEEDECARQAAQVLANFLCMQAEHQEDIGAASAMRAYYTRIALVEQQNIAALSLALIDSEEQAQAAIQERGLAAGTDLSSFERLRIEVMDKRLVMESQERQLRCLLSQLTGLDYAMNEVQHEQLEIFESPLDCNRLKAFALRMRSDLRAWIYLSRHINEESAPIFAGMLTTLIGGYGLPIPTISGLKQLLCPPDYSCLAANMKHEVDLTVETHRKWICQAVDEKCNKLLLAYQRIRLAQQLVASWEERLLQLDQLESRGEGQAAESAKARSELLKARSEEVSRRLDAKLAEIDLSEACGGLSLRCCNGQPWLMSGLE